MTITDALIDQDPTSTNDFDAYQNVHKGIRSELCAVVVTAGNADPADASARAALAHHVDDIVELLDLHAKKEEAFIHPILEAHSPALFEQLESDHGDLEPWIHRVAERAHEAVDCPTVEQRARLHNLYLDLSSFTGAYLTHQNREERVAMPALLDAIGVEGSMDLEHRLVASIPPPLLAKGLAVMVPAMNIEDRVEFLGGMKQSAPPEAFANSWGLVQSVLAPNDVRQLTARLGLD